MLTKLSLGRSVPPETAHDPLFLGCRGPGTPAQSCRPAGRLAFRALAPAKSLHADLTCRACCEPMAAKTHRSSSQAQAQAARPEPALCWARPPEAWLAHWPSVVSALC